MPSIVRLISLFALGTALIAGAFALTGAPAAAISGVPIPAPAGTEWEIVAGYNTRTHSVQDGDDQHAIDLVRVPREETAFTPLLSPVNGTVAWRGWDGLSITDANGFDHLLAHISPLEHITRGSRVSVGEHIATVCDAYECNNYGLPHIHYAVHVSNGNGYTGPSVPFTDSYALEGRELPWRDEFNLHAGVRFTSTNAPNWTAPPVESAEPEPTRTIPADAPVGGWRTVAVERNTSVAGLFADLDAPLSELVVRDAQRSDYQRFDPADPDSANIAVRSLAAGEAVWALVDSGAQWLPPPTATQQVTLRLDPGANLIAWLGPERHVAEALRNVAHLSHAYRYDPYSQTWQFWSVAGPAFLDTLTRLRTGDALYVVVRAGSTWTQLP